LSIGKRGTRPAVTALGFLAPALSLYLLFEIVPLVGTLAISLFDWEGYSVGSMRFVGLGNYAAVFRDPVFWKALGHNGLLLAGMVVLQSGLGLAMALLLETNVPAGSFFRALFFLPSVISVIVLGVVLSIVLSPSFGAAGAALDALHLSWLKADWLGSPQVAIWSVMLIQTVLGFGLAMFLFVAALKAIPDELYEAALSDGASKLRRVWHVTLPLVSEMAVVVTVVACINSLKTFGLVYSLTRGGPDNGTVVLPLWAYLQAFSYNRFGYGCAISTVLLALTLIVAGLQFRLGGYGRRSW